MATAIKDLRVQHNKINEQNKKLKDAKATAQKVTTAVAQNIIFM